MVTKRSSLETCLQTFKQINVQADLKHIQHKVILKPQTHNKHMSTIQINSALMKQAPKYETLIFRSVGWHATISATPPPFFDEIFLIKSIAPKW